MKIDELRIQARKLGIDVDLRWGLKRLEKVIKAASPDVPHGTIEKQEVSKVDRMNAYALRIWEGQSSSADLIWRVERIKAGLEAQGFTQIDQLKLPVEGFEKYL